MFLGVSLTVMAEMREQRVSGGNAGVGDVRTPAVVQGYNGRGTQRTTYLSYCHAGYRCSTCPRWSRAGPAGTWGGTGMSAPQLQSVHPPIPGPAPQSLTHPEWPPAATQRLMLTFQAQWGSRARMQSAQEWYLPQAARGSWTSWEREPAKSSFCRKIGDRRVSGDGTQSGTAWTHTGSTVPRGGPGREKAEASPKPAELNEGLVQAGPS